MSKLQATHTRDEILRTLRNTARTVSEVDHISEGTARSVVAQGEQIRRMQSDSEQIDKNLNVSERLIRSMKRGILADWGARLVPSWFTSKPPLEVPRSSAAAPREPEPIARAPLQPPAQDEIDLNLDQISSVLSTIKSRSQEMNTVLKGQNQQLERLVPRADTQSEVIRGQQRDIKRL